MVKVPNANATIAQGRHDLVLPSQAKVLEQPYPFRFDVRLFTTRRPRERLLEPAE